MDKIIAEAYRMYFKDHITFVQLVGIINKVYNSYAGEKYIFIYTPGVEYNFYLNLTQLLIKPACRQAGRTE